MKITIPEGNIHIVPKQSNVWSTIRNVVKNGNGEDAFYICDVSDIVRKDKIWKSKIPRVKPHYAVKCNDSKIVLDTLNALGAGFDCASKAEINMVLSMGVDPSRIIFANPAKPSSHIRHALDVGVTTMTFDNAVELYKIKKLYPNARMVIRIKCEALEAQCALGDKFGCDPVTEAPELLRIARDLNINVIGVSFHVGSGCREPPVFLRAIKASRDIFDYAQTLGFNFSLLDIGGGYPGAKDTSIDKIAEYINRGLEQYFPDPSVTVISEPGRFYVCSAYTLVCSIHSTRNVIQTDAEGNTIDTHHMYYINDGVYGSFNCILYDHQTVVPMPLEEHAGAVYRNSSIWGPTCDALDQVVKHVMLPEMKVGDWIVFENMGAYTLPVASPFNGFPIPEVHLTMDEKTWMLLKDVKIGNEHTEFLHKKIQLKMNQAIRKTEYDIQEFPIEIETPLRNGNSIEDHIFGYFDIARV